MSLCERKIFALIQMRCGPALTWYGIVTPISDGCKLFVKFLVFIVTVDFFLLYFCFLFLILVMYLVWLIFPLGMLCLLDYEFSFLILVICHFVFIHFCFLMVGFVCLSCFVYLSCLRSIFFCILLDCVLSLFMYVFFVLDICFCVKMSLFGQLYVNYFLLLGCFFCLCFAFLLCLDSFRVPFDYVECESELVAGMVTEFSGLFFVCFSLFETNHGFLCILMYICLVLGGCFISFKFFLIVLCFFVPQINLLPCSIKS